MRILVTGVAGFIGSHVAMQLLGRGDDVIGLDNLNAYYDPTLKEARLNRIKRFATGVLDEPLDPAVYGDGRRVGRFHFERLDISDRPGMEEFFQREPIDRVVHLAAQAGVRHSLEAPFDYIDSNITGFLTILEGCRHHGTDHLVYASTSSVYGASTDIPFSVAGDAEHPVALYGASKRANELMAHSYAHLFNMPTTGLRFFTVYGPWGRPDMALFLFTRKILAGERIEVFNYGNHKRDFTFVDDIAQGVIAALDHPAEGQADWQHGAQPRARSAAPWRLHNIGNQRPVELLRYIEVLEACLGRTAEKTLLPLQPGDIPDTWADVTSLTELTGYQPKTSVEEGVRRFVDWYKRYYQLN
ncbi:MAG: NAD-dependent epimerase [Rhodothalassiaceae bacterium]